MNAIGHNNPPVATPHELCAESVDQVMLEARNWLDGAAIESQEQADAVGKLIDVARKTRKAVDDQRKVEKKSHDDAAQAVQDVFNPLLKECDKAIDGCKKLAGEWLKKVEAENRRKAADAAAEAEARRIELQKAVEHTNPTDLAQVEAREEAIEAVKEADAIAARAEKKKAHAKGGDRAVGLVSRWRADVYDRKAFLSYLIRTDPDMVTAFLQEQADKAVKQTKGDLPGVNAIEERVAR